jgi:hypothetical protein
MQLLSSLRTPICFANIAMLIVMHVALINTAMRAKPSMTFGRKLKPLKKATFGRSDKLFQKKQLTW